MLLRMATIAIPLTTSKQRHSVRCLRLAARIPVLLSPCVLSPDAAHQPRQSLPAIAVIFWAFRPESQGH